ncbi:TonB-dependent receptor plug domain-containing protein [Ulvibacter antarcticus]|uniref:Iron complex outermembrane receptor protein n=1 Tax=Ulvibacter antarcticus TaxID=442714 RepID=A0A3L9Z2Q5_9FLAO|nr:TonB-dependent receptor [Ulvibacter antarcticus]RMA64628.1 iron complex outermembrane receptor protein [Ulvibacter antarcticus]
MNQIYTAISTLVLLCATPVYAQLDSLQQLETVVLTDVRLTTFSDGYKLQAVSDSIISKNNSLTDLLRDNTSIYFKENGYGMVSSPSFRGTNASQTAVIWNGIAINSALTGQSDFNALPVNAYNSITVRSGGGSVQYGSGAIGGSVHLNNELQFIEQRDTEIGLSCGSYTTPAAYFKSSVLGRAVSVVVGGSFISSENDYDYIDRKMKNENGEFLRFNANASVGFKLKQHLITWNSEYFYGDRSFSGSLTAPSNSAYNDISTRNLLRWRLEGNRFASTFKLAHLMEQYRYFPNRDRYAFNKGLANSYIAGYVFDYKAGKNIELSFDANFTRIEGSGDNLDHNARNNLAGIFLLKHRLTKKLSYGLNLRQELLNDFENPFLFSFDALLEVNKWYALKINGSKNYRTPSFNDLFWTDGGNPNLEPETSFQGEFGNVIKFGKLQLDLNAFYIASENLIQWRPNTSGVWSPENVSEAQNYGLEVSINYTRKFRSHALNFSSNYAYTKAINSEKNTQQIYVPFHKATGTISYAYKKLVLFVQSRYTGEVYTTTDNIGVVAASHIINSGIDYTFNQADIPITIAIKANNIFNTYYENVAYRPMPDRNFETSINIKF